MEYVTLSHTDLMVSRISLGGCPMGGYGWGDTNEQDFIAAICAALDKGINFFDTANVYGLGQAESTLAKGLAGHRHEVVIQSKFGVRVMQDMVGRKTIYDNSPEFIRQALEGTLKRLGTDYLDIYTIHYRDKSTPLEEVVEDLKELRREGKIRYFGLSNIHGDDLEEFRTYKKDFICCQNEYSLAQRTYEQDLQTARDEIGLTPLTWGSLGQGILTGKYDANVKFTDNDRRSRDIYKNFHGEKLLKNLEIVETMKPIAKAHDKSLSAVAIRFILDKLPGSVALVGAKNTAQIEANLTAMDWNLTERELTALDEVSRNQTMSPANSGGVKNNYIFVFIHRKRQNSLLSIIPDRTPLFKEETALSNRRAA